MLELDGSLKKALPQVKAMKNRFVSGTACLELSTILFALPSFFFPRRVQQNKSIKFVLGRVRTQLSRRGPGQGRRERRSTGKVLCA